MLWFLCSVKLFFDIDYLKLTPSNMYLFTNGKLRHGNIDPYLPSSLARDPTLFDFFQPNEPLPHLDNRDQPINPDKKHITLRDVKYANNCIDLFNDFKIGLTWLIESIVQKTDDSPPQSNANEPKKGLARSKVPKELNALPPLLQAVEAILVLILFFALVFDFDELLSTATPPDLKI